MKKILFALLIVSAVAIAAPGSASAQSSPAIVKVPFQFIVGDTLLPAGSYRITASAENPSLLAVTNLKGAPAAFALAPRNGEAATKAAHAHVAFRKIGGQYFLSTVATPDMACAMMFTTAEAERTLAKLNLAGADHANVAK